MWGSPSRVLAVAALLSVGCGAKTGLLVAESTRDGSAGGGTGSRDGGWMDGARRADADADSIVTDGAADGSRLVTDGTVARDDGSVIADDAGPDYVGPVVGVAAGSEHTCVWRSTGEVLCWGRNDFGQAGRPASPSVTGPSLVAGVTAVHMALGSRHTCAVDSAGAVWCWGLDTWGMLGTDGPEQTERPQRVAGLPPIARVTAGWSHTCALAVAGDVYCWGKNDAGQIGIDTTLDQHRPVRVAALGATANVTTGRAHTCAVTTDGVAHCWGGNYAGQLGLGTDGSALLPLTVPGVGPMLAISANETSTCAIGRDRRVQCWGSAGAALSWCGGPCPPGRCGGGDGGVDEHPFVPFSGRAEEVAVGRAHGCLVDTSRVLRCWGDDARRQLGFRPAVGCDGSPCTGDGLCSVAEPGAVDGISDVSSFAVGYDHTCAVDGRHDVYCWGDNGLSQAGSGGEYVGGYLVVAAPTRIAGL